MIISLKKHINTLIHSAELNSDPCIILRNKKILYCNSNFRHKYGNISSLKALSLLFIDNSNYDSFLKTCIVKLKKSHPFEYDCKFNDNKGFTDDVHLKVINYTDNVKDLNWMISIHNHLSLQRTSKELEENDHELKLLFNEMVSGFALLKAIEKDDSSDTDFEFVRINPSYEWLLNIQRDKVIGKTISQIFPDTPSSKFEVLRRVLLKGRPMKYEEYYKDLDKSFEVVAYSPKTNYIATFYSDITQRKRIETRLKVSEQRLQMALEGANDGIWDYYYTTNELYWSPRCYSLLGYKDFEFRINTNALHDLIIPEDRSRVFSTDKAFLPEKSEFVFFEVRMLNKNNEIRWILGRGKVVERNHKNEALRIVGTLSDITQSKTYEQELIEARIRAEESDKLKSAFLANMSHEIRTPMNSILGFSQLLADEDIAEQKKKQYIDIINNSAEYLLSIITDIIDISKLEAKQIRIHESIINIAKFLEELELIANSILVKNDKKGIEIRVKNMLPADYDLFIDEVRVKQIMLNLINNSIKFTEAGFIEIGCKLIENDTNIEFFVYDTGVGIDPAKKHLIFERFAQADLSISRKYGGTGLGLSISKGLAELMKGYITLDSKLGGPTYFSVVLPLNKKTQEKFELPKIKSIFTDMKWIDKTILIAEDEYVNLAYLKEILSMSGVKIIEARTGIEAIKLYEENSDISLILMDIRMPEMNGYEATKIIVKKDPSAIIIAVTAFAQEFERLECLKAGCTDFLTKPVKKELLLSTIEKFI